jgi:2-aminoadipate transaminase
MMNSISFIRLSITIIVYHCACYPAILFLWLTLPEEINARELLKKSLANNVAFVPGGAFFPNGGHENTIRLNYSYSTDETIVEGISRLGEVIGVG